MLYQHYAAKWMLPSLRLEMTVARLGLAIAQANGVEAQLSDFMFLPQEEVDEEVAAKEFFGFKPVQKPSPDEGI